MSAYENWFLSVRQRLENEKEVSVSFKECWCAATKAAEEKFTSTNSAMVPCPKHVLNTTCPLTPAWVCKKEPCQIDRTQHQ
jgi:hypothetical protein